MSRLHSSPLEDDDLLWEILLRLPPRPSSLPRASLVCPRWRSVVSDAKFRRRFREHHRKPPLLGFFARRDGTNPAFTPLLDPPDRIPAQRFAVPLESDWAFVGCRHGLAVLISQSRREAVVWDPLTGQQRHMPFPKGFDNNRLSYWHATVLCVDAEDGHVHGDCFSSPFKLVLICACYRHAIGVVYDSASGVWGNIISIVTTGSMSPRPGIIIGSAVYWFIREGGVLAFDIERQSLSIIEKPRDVHYSHFSTFQHFRTEDSTLGIAVIPMSEQNIQLWASKSNSDGVVSWVLQKTVQLEELFSPLPHMKTRLLMRGYDEDTNAIFLSSDSDDFMLQLETMQVTHIGNGDPWSFRIYYPYTNFYTTVRAIAGRDSGAENVNT